MKIVSLIENTSSAEGIEAEHGLSLYIETNGRRILFDMGQSDAFERNASLLGVDLSEVDTAILSHGHYDHGGGLERFCELNDKADVYMSNHAFESHYNGVGKYIGLDGSFPHTDRIRFVRETVDLGNGLTVYTDVDCSKRPIENGGMTYSDTHGSYPEDFRHEIYLMVHENGKNVLFSGCSHRGVIAIAEHFTPDVLVGGFHYSKLPTDEALTEKAKILDSLPCEYHTCHCTGTEQYGFMKKYIKKLGYLSAGQVLVI